MYFRPILRVNYRDSILSVPVYGHFACRFMHHLVTLRWVAVVLDIPLTQFCYFGDRFMGQENTGWDFVVVGVICVNHCNMLSIRIVCDILCYYSGLAHRDWNFNNCVSSNEKSTCFFGGTALWSVVTRVCYFLMKARWKYWWFNPNMVTTNLIFFCSLKQRRHSSLFSRFLAIRLLHGSVQVGQSLRSSCCFFECFAFDVGLFVVSRLALMFGSPSKRQWLKIQA